jgi:predicted transcriptional regulator
VETIMTRSVTACGPGDALQAIWSAMKQRGVQRVPVVAQDGQPIGVIYAHDALQLLLSEVEDEESLLRDYVMNIGYR